MQRDPTFESAVADKLDESPDGGRPRTATGGTSSSPIENMSAHQKIAIANFALVFGVAIAWLAGASGAAFIAVGTATLGFASLWPRYKYERGIWMLGGLVALFTLFAFFIGLVELFASGIRVDAPRSGLGTVAIVVGIVILAFFLVFVSYASVINYRLSRAFAGSLENGPIAPKQDGE